MFKKKKNFGRLLSKSEQRSISGGRVYCRNIAPGEQCGGTGCWLQNPTRCCCAET